MMKGYILKRLLRSVISILVIMFIVFTLIFTSIPRENIFFEDSVYRKLGGKPDEKTEYVYNTWKKLGYLDYVRLNDYCLELYEAGSEEIQKAVEPDSPEAANFVELYQSRGYNIGYFSVSKRPLERKIYFGRTPTGGLALIGSGTYHKYLLYTDSKFPFIHQNFITLNMGESYPTYQGIEALNVMFSSQGSEVKREVTFETGETGKSAINFGSLTYKENLDRMDKKKFVDHYANYTTFKDQSSMVGTSFIMGFFALLLMYGIGLPIGVLMARRKDGLIDIAGMFYIIFITSVPSVAYIFIFRHLGTTLFGLPSLFTTFGPSDIRSWILPTISLALPSIAGNMMWIRRYVVDQMNSDYVKFAKAKGLNRKEIFRKHIFKNASIPIAHGVPTALAGCITGAIVTEAIYSVGGMGKMLPNAINQYNNVIIIALTFIFSTISVLSVLVGDIILTKVDPRISLTGKAGRS